MNYKALALGAVIGFVVALTPSCSGTEKCSAANCNGCCNGDQCVTVDQQNVTTCGASGVACTACAANQVCVGGLCENTGTGGDAGTDAGPGNACGPSTCPNGCCGKIGNNPVCLSGQSPANCGSGGAACSSCTGGKTCQSNGPNLGGACVAPPDAGQPNTGAACASDSDCSGGNTCRKESATGNFQYDGGYCTRTCTQPSDCASDAICVGVSHYGEDAICLKSCQGPTDCRSPGYTCYGVGNNQGACWVEPLPEVDAGPPAPDDLVGSACAANEDCQADGGFAAGGCIPPTNPDGGPSGFTDGYCTADCSEVDCGNTAICINFGQGQNGNVLLCTDRCTNGGNGQDDCRPGYVCEQYGMADGGLSQDGFCWQACNAAGAGCPAGRTCNTLGYCQ